ncbi:MAG: RNA polymerase sigma factor [Candidatus Zixiibacteriota bacterium]|nr:MAG: RNA polymerase sigma factor [candidate division Zixibacteria bacterium]
MDSDKDLFWKLVESEHLKARALCRKLIGSRDDGDDLYHDALLAARKGFSGLRDPEAFIPWFYRIIVNAFKRRVKRPWCRRLLPITPGVIERAGGLDPTDGYAARRYLERAFKVLSPDDQAVVIMFELDGRSTSEIAQMLGKSEGSVRVRLHRARGRMREALARFQSTSTLESVTEPALTKENLCVVTKPKKD